MTAGVISILTWRSCAQAHDSPLGCLHAAENTIHKQWNDGCTLYWLRILLPALDVREVGERGSHASQACDMAVNPLRYSPEIMISCPASSR